MKSQIGLCLKLHIKMFDWIKKGQETKNTLLTMYVKSSIQLIFFIQMHDRYRLRYKAL